MAATRLIALHINKGKTVAQCLRERTDYAQNPEKTAKGELVTGYQCDPMTVDEEFLLSKRQYQHITGKHQKHEVIAYQIRQSFKPGEITPEEANQVGYELAERFTKGKHAFIVATHTDRAHIHNHIIFNSTTLDCAHKFKDFYYSGLAIQRLSDLICLEHGLSIIEKVPYSQRRKRTIYEKRTTYRDQIRQDIDTILKKPPINFDAFLRKLEEIGYEVKQGKHTAVKGKDQQRFVRLNSLGEGYAEEDIRAVIAGEKKHRSKIKSPLAKEDRVFNLLLIIDDKIRAKGPGYQQWATNYNLKQMAKTRIFLKEHNINSMDELREKANSTSADFDRIDKELKSAEQRLVEIAALTTPKPARSMFSTERQATAKRSLKPIGRKSPFIKRQRMPSRKWAYPSCQRSRNCRRSMPLFWSRKRAYTRSTGSLEKKCGSIRRHSTIRKCSLIWIESVKRMLVHSRK